MEKALWMAQIWWRHSSKRSPIRRIPVKIAYLLNLWLDSCSWKTDELDKRQADDKRCCQSADQQVACSCFASDKRFSNWDNEKYWRWPWNGIRSGIADKSYPFHTEVHVELQRRLRRLRDRSHVIGSQRAISFWNCKRLPRRGEINSTNSQIRRQRSKERDKRGCTAIRFLALPSTPLSPRDSSSSNQEWKPPKNKMSSKRKRRPCRPQVLTTGERGHADDPSKADTDCPSQLVRKNLGIQSYRSLSRLMWCLQKYLTTRTIGNTTAPFPIMRRWWRSQQSSPSAWKRSRSHNNSKTLIRQRYYHFWYNSRKPLTLTENP